MFIRFIGRPFFTDDDGAPAGGETPEDAFDKERALSTIRKLREFEKEAKARLKELDDLKAAQVEQERKAAEQSGEYRRLYEAEQAKAAALEAKAAADLAAAQAELATLRQREAIAQAAQASGYKPQVLATLVGSLPLAVREVGDGKDRKAVAYLTDADGKEHKLTAYAEAHWADFLPALAPAERPQPYDINAGARGAQNGMAPTEEERKRISAHYATRF